MADKTFQDYIMSKLDEIHSAKLGKVEPTHVTLDELSKALDREMRNILNDLFCQGKINVGDTLNGKYIVSHRWENSSRQQHTTAPTTSEH